MQSGEYDQAIILGIRPQLLLDGYGALRRTVALIAIHQETRAVNPDAAKCLAVTIEFERSYFGRQNYAKRIRDPACQ